MLASSRLSKRASIVSQTLCPLGTAWQQTTTAAQIAMRCSMSSCRRKRHTSCVCACITKQRRATLASCTFDSGAYLMAVCVYQLACTCEFPVHVAEDFLCKSFYTSPSAKTGRVSIVVTSQQPECSNVCRRQRSSGQWPQSYPRVHMMEIALQDSAAPGQNTACLVSDFCYEVQMQPSCDVVVFDCDV
jgi:hypothetical protein